MQTTNYFNFIDRPLYFVSLSMEDKKAGNIYKNIKYLKLSVQGKNDILETSTNKTEAVSLKVLSDRFLSDSEGSLGHHVHEVIKCQADFVGREGAERTKTGLIGYLDTIIKYTKSHEETLAFKIKNLLAFILPKLFSSPSLILADRLSALQSIKDKIEREYQSHPTSAEVEVQRKKDVLARVKKDLSDAQEAYANTQTILEEIVSFTAPYDDVKSPALDDTVKQKLSHLNKTLNDNIYKLPKPKQDEPLTLEQQKIKDSIKEKNCTPGLQMHVEEAFKRLKYYELTLEERETEFANYINKTLSEIAKLEEGTQAIE